MLVPRFSTRAVLVVTALFAVLFLMIGLGMRGTYWAGGVAIAASSLLFMALVHAALFGMCYVVARPRTPRQHASNRLGAAAGAAQTANPSPRAESKPADTSFHISNVLVALLAVPAFVLATGGALRAATGNIVTLPPANVTPKSGIRVTVDSTWVDNYGYLPLTVTIASQKPATADQTVTFRFHAGTWRMGTAPVMSVDQDIELPRGATTATATVLVPKLQEWNDVWWDVLVDGSFEKELSWDRGRMGWLNSVSQFAGDNSPRILVVADANMQVSISSAVLATTAYQQQVQVYGGGYAVAVPQAVATPVQSTSTTTVSIAGMSFAVQRTVAELPKEWLAYSALDYLVLTPAQLVQIQDENQEAWAAIERWVRSGGNLWLHDVAAAGDGGVSGWSQIEEVLPRLASLVDAAEGQQPRWFVPYSASNLNPSAVYTRESNAQQRGGPLSENDQSAWRPAGLGAVLVSQQPLDQLIGQEWTWLQEQDGQQLGWQMRHGTAPSQPNGEFANFLIPGVGLAPVTEFRILITLFVLLIGPVNYWFLKRAKRLHLLILTVPLAALLVTLALFGYAVVGDGFSARVRAISYTSLDQKAGEATSWARLSYYAGLAPSGGLDFPKDTAVYPVNSAWSEAIYYGNEVKMVPRSVQWADRQYLTEGWLASRTPTQYLTVAARKSDRGLRINRPAGGIEVQNLLGAQIELLVLRDEDGRLYEGESIADDGSATLTAVEKESDVAGRLRRLFDARRPAFPEAFQAEVNRMRARYGGPGMYDYYGGIETISSSRLMQRINSFTQPVDSQTGRSVNLEEGAYLAITDRGVDLPTGLDDPEEEASFHVVEGRW
jgi:hypothetical protein